MVGSDRTGKSTFFDPISALNVLWSPSSVIFWFDLLIFMISFFLYGFCWRYWDERDVYFSGSLFCMCFFLFDWLDQNDASILMISIFCLVEGIEMSEVKFIWFSLISMWSFVWLIRYENESLILTIVIFSVILWFFEGIYFIRSYLYVIFCLVNLIWKWVTDFDDIYIYSYGFGWGHWDYWDVWVYIFISFLYWFQLIGSKYRISFDDLYLFMRLMRMLNLMWCLFGSFFAQINYVI